MKRMSIHFAVTLLWLLASGCVTQMTVHQVPTNPGTATGMVYFLPYAEYEIALKRELLACQPQPADPLMRGWLTEELSNLDRIRDCLSKLEDERFATKKDLGAAVVKHCDDAAPAVRVDAQELAKRDGAQFLVDAQVLKQLDRLLLDRLVVESPVGFEAAWPRSYASQRRQVRKIADYAKARQSLAIYRNGLKSGHVEYRVRVGQAVDVTPHLLPDVEKTYAIEHEAMATGLKKTALHVEKYPNGTLKSINAEIEDRTAEVAGSLIRGAFNVAALTSGFAPVLAVPDAAAAGAALADDIPSRAPRSFAGYLDAHGLCRSQIVAALGQRAALKKKQAANSASLAELERFAGARTAELVGVKGPLAEATAADEKLKMEGVHGDDPRRKELAERIAALSKQKAELDKILGARAVDRRRLQQLKEGLTRKLAEASKPLVLTTVYTFDPGIDHNGAQPGLERQAPVPGDSKAKARWFVKDQVEKYCESSASACYQEGDDNGVPRQLKAVVAAYLPSGRNAAGFAQTIDSGHHLVYREPLRGELLVCKETDCLVPRLDPNDSTRVVGWERQVKTADLTYSKVADFPQLGALATLPLKNASFENNAFTAEWAASGALMKFDYRSNARAEKAAKLFEESTTAAGEFFAAKRNATKDKLALATEELEAEKARLEAELAVEEARAALDQFRSAGADAGDADSSGDVTP